jgi:IgGFc binding protein/Bacterial Ig-like domain (group 1)
MKGQGMFASRRSHARKTVAGPGAIVAVLAACVFSLAPAPMAFGDGGTTTVGTDFWVTFPPNYASSGITYDLDISGSQATTGSVTPQGASSIPFSVTVGQVTTVAVTDVVPQADDDDTVDEGVHITAAAPVTVYGLNIANGTSDAYTALPTPALGTRYRVASYGPTISGYPSRLTVVAASDGTTVTVTPSVTVGSHTAGAPFTEDLSQGEVYTLADNAGDLTGTLITSNNPVAVYGSVDCVDISSGAGGACDVIMQQMPPATEWGTDFVAVRFAKQQNGDPFRVVADTDGTVVSVNGAQVATLNAGQYYQTTLAPPSGSDLNVGVHITTSQPALVVQYQTAGTYTEGATSTTGDPSMMVVPPDQQFLSSYTVGVPSQFVVNDANIVIPTSATSSLLLDGSQVSASAFGPIAGTSFSSAQLPLQPGSHTLSASLPFGVWVYGENSANSYAYPGGYSASPVATIASLSLGGTQPYSAQVGQQICIPVTVEDANGNPVAGILVTASVTGANPTSTYATTGSTGTTDICYTGTNAGTDTVTLTAGSVTTSATVNYTAAPATTTTLTPTSTTVVPTSVSTTTTLTPTTTTVVPTSVSTSTTSVTNTAPVPPVSSSPTPLATAAPTSSTTSAPRTASTVPASMPLPVPTGGGVAATPAGAGYWAFTGTGQISSYGDAGAYGSEKGKQLRAPITGLASTTNGRGYWLVGADGGVFNFGDAHFYGSMSGRHLDQKVVGIARTPDNRGYWLVGADGGVFNFGDAHFYGSMSGRHLDQKVVGIAAAPHGHGYWLVAADGGVFAFGDAHFYGSMVPTRLNRSAVGIAAAPDGHGYWLVAADGGVFAFGDAHFYGSTGANPTATIVGLVANGDMGYRLITASGHPVNFGLVPRLGGLAPRAQAANVK